METTDRHDLPMILPSQAQKHVTHNEALTIVDALLHPVIVAEGIDTPPLDADAGDIFVVGDAPTGDWTDRGGEIAILSAVGWRFTPLLPGMVARFSESGQLKVFDGVGWNVIASGSEIRFERLGIGTEADATNRLAVRSSAALLTHIPDSEGGSGDARIVVNRETSADNASVVFQSGFSGRAEFGLAGDDAFRLKVSADGTSWTDALAVGMEGSAAFPGPLSAASFATQGGATVWTSGNDGAGSGLDADLWNGRSFQAFSGAATTTGSADWNSTANLSRGFAQRLMQGSDANGFGLALRYHCWNIEYGASGYLTQIAIPWGHSGAVESGLHVRGFYNGTWSSWQKLWSSGNDGSGSGLTADLMTSYTVGTLPSAAARGAGALVFVTNESGGAVPAFSDGTSWRRVTDRVVVS